MIESHNASLAETPHADSFPGFCLERVLKRGLTLFRNTKNCSKLACFLKGQTPF